MKNIKFVVFAICFLLLQACGSSSENVSPSEVQSDTAGVTKEGLLHGQPDQRIADATVDIAPKDGYSSEEVEETPDGRRIIRTKLLISFKNEATVSDVNEVLTRFNAIITSTVENDNSVLARIPDPASLDALKLIVSEMEAEPVVRFVLMDGELSPFQIPGNIYPYDDISIARVDHHLAIDAHAAWNAKEAMNSAPTILVPDFYGHGAINSDLDYINKGSEDDFDIMDSDEPIDPKIASHGYHVLGIIAGRFEEGTPLSDRKMVTGIYPNTIDLSVINAFNFENISLIEAQQLIIQRAKDIQGNLIVNTSWGFRCTNFLSCRSAEEINNEALYWLSLVRIANLENRMLHLTAAGNITEELADSFHAQRASSFAAARLLHEITDYQGIIVPNLTNTLVVESATGSLGETLCQSRISFVDGNIAGIGTDIYSFIGAQTGADNLSGTSMAAPQVSGLAAYLWSIKPSLTPQEIIGVLQSSATPLEPSTDTKCSGWSKPAPLINAYRASLALDASLSAPHANNTPVRLALFDLDSDADFDEDDLSVWVQRVHPLVAPLLSEFDRYDLNGDGFTGGYRAERFDLDLDNEYGNLLGNMAFNELALTDFEILCYYAYSDLYTGSVPDRDLVHLPECFAEGASWFTEGSSPLYVNRSEVNNDQLNPPTAVHIAEGLVLNTATFTDYESGDLNIELLGPIQSTHSGSIGFGSPSDLSSHTRIQYCIDPDAEVECWESVGGTISVKASGDEYVMYFSADMEMYFDINGSWLSMEAISANGTHIIDESRTLQQTLIGKARFTPAEPEAVAMPSDCEDVPTLLINPSAEAAGIVTAQPPIVPPNAQNPLACNQMIPNNTEIRTLSGPFDDAVFGDSIQWYEIEVNENAINCAGSIGYAVVSSISFANQLCDTADALITSAPNTGAPKLISDADILNASRLCTSFGNASVILGSVVGDQSIPGLQLRQVDVLNGPCAGQSGYVDELYISIP